MSDTKNILIIAATVLLAMVIFCFGTRYQLVATKEKDLGFSYRLDRITGKTWVCVGDKCKPVEER